MKPYTQSNTTPGNCWQTAVACILEMDPAELPDQVEIEARGVTDRKPQSYHNLLNAYLAKHHNLIYHELYDWQVMGIDVTAMDGYHVICGPTVRTATNGFNHAVVGRRGEVVWDPHPDQTGLIGVTLWGIVTPTTPENLAHRLKWHACLCPKCQKGD